MRCQVHVSPASIADPLSAADSTGMQRLNVADGEGLTKASESSGPRIGIDDVRRTRDARAEWGDVEERWMRRSSKPAFFKFRELADAYKLSVGFLSLKYDGNLPKLDATLLHHTRRHRSEVVSADLRTSGALQGTISPVVVLRLGDRAM